jgi:hypothetical protein
MDPANRLVAGELEARWNAALLRQSEIEAKITAHDASAAPGLNAMPGSFVSLADDLQTVWQSPTTDARLKKRIVRSLIHEIIADIDDQASQGRGTKSSGLATVLFRVLEWHSHRVTAATAAARPAQQHTWRCCRGDHAADTNCQ